jgi:hypothetical protein
MLCCPREKMKITHVKVTDLKINEKFNISSPLIPKRYSDFKIKFPYLPAFIINNSNEIIFGFDFFTYLIKQNPEAQVLAFQPDIRDYDALILQFNLKNRLWGHNLFEKLLFIKKISPAINKQNLFKQTDLDIKVNPALLKKLDLLTSEIFKKILENEKIHLKTALKLCDFNIPDRTVLIDLFNKIIFSSSHQQKIIELIQEICFRDKCPVGETFQKLHIDLLFKNEMPQKKILEKILRHRFPEYSKEEEIWKRKIQKFNLPNNIKINHSPFFEKKQIELMISLTDSGRLEEILEKLSNL